MQRQVTPLIASRISLVAAALGMRAHELDRRHQHRRRAEPALQAVVLGERLLQRAQRPVALGQALDGLDRVAVGLHGEHEARAHALPVEQHVAVAAEAVLAGKVRAGQVEVLAQEVGERAAGLDGALAPAAVDLDPHRMHRRRPGRSRCLLGCGARGGVQQRSARQDAGDTAPVGAGDLDVIRRIELVDRCGDRRERALVESLPRTIASMSARCGVPATRSSTSVADAACAAGVEPDDRGRADLRVVAVARADLVEGGSTALPGGGEADGGDQLVVPERSLVRAAEELARGDRAVAALRARLDRRVERDGDGRELGPGRRERERAADRARGGASRDSRRTAAPRGSAATSARRRGSSSSVCWRTRAPTTSSPSRSSIASSPATRLMSTSARGLTRRNFISGIGSARRRARARRRRARAARRPRRWSSGRGS